MYGCVLIYICVLEWARECIPMRLGVQIGVFAFVCICVCVYMCVYVYVHFIGIFGVRVTVGTCIRNSICVRIYTCLHEC